VACVLGVVVVHTDLFESTRSDFDLTCSLAWISMPTRMPLSGFFFLSFFYQDPGLHVFARHYAVIGPRLAIAVPISCCSFLPPVFKPSSLISLQDDADMLGTKIACGLLSWRNKRKTKF
jgi:hypothetical protein